MNSKSKQFREDIKQIFLNSSHYVENSGNKFKYTFPKDIQFNETMQISMPSIHVYNCVDNVNSSYGNNTFDLYFPSGNTEIKLSYTIPDGYYTISDMNTCITNFMLESKLYLDSAIDSGSATTFIYLSTNDTQYGSVIVFSPVPTSLGTSYIMPANAGFTLPTTSRTPRIKFCDGLETLLGMNYNSIIPSNNVSTSALTIYSNDTPIISPIDTYVITCNLIHNSFSIPTNLFASIPVASVSFGEMIVKDVYPLWINTMNINTKELILTFLSQDLNNITLRDKEISIVICIKTMVEI